LHNPFIFEAALSRLSIIVLRDFAGIGSAPQNALILVNTIMAERILIESGISKRMHPED
jgi:hypothetical protein